MNIFNFRFFIIAVWCPLGSNLCKHAGGQSVTTEACTSPYLTGRALCGMEVWKLIEAICAMGALYKCRKRLCNRYAFGVLRVCQIWDQNDNTTYLQCTIGHQIGRRRRLISGAIITYHWDTYETTYLSFFIERNNRPRLWITKAPLENWSVRDIFIMQIYLLCFLNHFQVWWGFITVELRWHTVKYEPDMN